MKGTKMILLGATLGLSMFLLQGYGNADDSGMRAGKMQKTEESTMMQDGDSMNKAQAPMEGSIKNDMEKSMDSDMKKPKGKAMEQMEKDEMEEVMPMTKDGSMQEEMNTPMENGQKMMQ